MNKKVKSQWVKALRSGKYKKTTGHLKDDKGYCCLGVLCDIYTKSTEGKKKKAVMTGNGIVISNITESGILPPQVQQWAGLSQNNPEVKIFENKVEQVRNLAEVNDDFCVRKRKGFGWIADLIEKQL